MVTDSFTALHEAYRRIAWQFEHVGSVSCGVCGLSNLTPEGLIEAFTFFVRCKTDCLSALYLHMPLYHILLPSTAGPRLQFYWMCVLMGVSELCGICGKTSTNLQVHIHEEHAPPGYKVEGWMHELCCGWMHELCCGWMYEPCCGWVYEPCCGMKGLPFAHHSIKYNRC